MLRSCAAVHISWAFLLPLDVVVAVGPKSMTYEWNNHCDVLGPSGRKESSIEEESGRALQARPCLVQSDSQDA